MFREYWINGLISGLATHTTYGIGNALLAFWKAVPETAVAAGIGQIRHLVGDEGERVYMGEVGAGLYGLLKGQRDGIRAAWKAAQTGLTTELLGESEGAAAASFVAMQPRGAIPGKLGEIVRLPSRGVATIHSYFRTIGYEQAIAQMAYRQAAREGLAGNEFSARVADLTANPPPEMMQQARDAATDQTLMNGGGEFTRWLSQGVNKFPIVNLVDPFVKISSNALQQALAERSPIGVLDPEIRANLMGRNGAVARDTQIARIAVGGALGTAMLGLAFQDLTTGSAPSDPKEAAVWRMTGKQPYSVRIGDTWYDYHRLGPLAMIMGVAADMYEFGSRMDHTDFGHVTALLVTSIAKNLLDESFMKGPSDLMQAVDDPTRYGGRYVQDQLGTLLPYSTALSQMARATDPYAREARTTMDAIKARIPWLSQTLLPRYDIWGQPIPNLDAVGAAGLTEIMESRERDDPVIQAMQRLQVFPSPLRHEIFNVELTDQQYADYSRVAGRMAKMRATALINAPGFAVLPPGLQQKVLNDTINSGRRMGAAWMKMRYPQLIAQGLEVKRVLATQGKQAAREAAGR